MDIPTRAEIVQIEDLRIDRNIGKVCTCHKPKRIINTRSRQVFCEDCGAMIDPFDALLTVARQMDSHNHAIHRIRDQAEVLKKYKPYLKVIQQLEKEYRGKKMLPNCPRCDEPFYLEELNHWTDRFIADVRIQVLKEQEMEQ